MIEVETKTNKIEIIVNNGLGISLRILNDYMLNPRITTYNTTKKFTHKTNDDTPKTTIITEQAQHQIEKDTTKNLYITNIYIEGLPIATNTIHTELETYIIKKNMTE